MIRLVGALTVLWSFIPAEACTCEAPAKDLKSYLASADVIFEGVAGESVPTTPPSNKGMFRPVSATATTFTVKRVWKGDVTMLTRVLSTEPCGLSFEKGQAWLVHAWKNDDGSFSTGRCSGSRELGMAERELDWLRTGAKSVGARPASTMTAWKKEKGGTSRELRFTDMAGEHLVKFNLTDVKSKKVEDGYARSRELVVTHTLGGKAVWQAKDFVKQCVFDLALELYDDSVEVTDVDENGFGEISFLYKLGCRSDVSPDTAKLLLYEGPTKFALRGETREQVGETEFAGGEFQADPAFETAPAAFLDFATAKWRRVIGVK